MAAVLTTGKGFYHPLVYVPECHRLDWKLLPQAMNELGPAFVPHCHAHAEEQYRIPTNLRYACDDVEKWT